jgi:hypothetical protein
VQGEMGQRDGRKTIRIKRENETRKNRCKDEDKYENNICP